MKRMIKTKLRTKTDNKPHFKRLLTPLLAPKTPLCGQKAFLSRKKWTQSFKMMV